MGILKKPITMIRIICAYSKIRPHYKKIFLGKDKPESVMRTIKIKIPIDNFNANKSLLIKLATITMR